MGKRTKRLTPRQREILDFIKSFISEIGYPPTLKDIAEGFRFSEKASNDHVQVLVKKGYLEKEDGKPRSLRLTPLARMFVFSAPSTYETLGIQEGDMLTISPAAVPMIGDCVLTEHGRIRKFQDGQAVVGKVIGLSRPLQ